jgi:hypothetical protein
MTETSTISNGTGSPVSIAEVVTGQIVDLSGTGMALFSDLEPTESCSFAFVNKISYKGTVVFDGTSVPRHSKVTLAPPLVLAPGESCELSVFLAPTTFIGRTLIKDAGSVILVEMQTSVHP